MYRIYYLAVVAVMSAFTFCLYYADKRRAIKNRRRIPEKVLLLCSVFFGALGGLGAMAVCRHKTKHFYFVVINVVALFVHALIFVLLLKTN